MAELKVVSVASREVTDTSRSVEMSKEAAALKGEVVGVTSVEVAFEGTIDFGNGDKLDLQEHGLATVTVTLDVIPNEAEQVKLDALT